MVFIPGIEIGSGASRRDTRNICGGRASWHGLCNSFWVLSASANPHLPSRGIQPAQGGEVCPVYHEPVRWGARSRCDLPLELQRVFWCSVG